MVKLEREKTYLAAYIPNDLADYPSQIISDVYIGVGQSGQPSTLRLRRKGDTYCMTKKIPVQGTDSSRQHEHTIELSQVEYEALAGCSDKILTKRRFVYPLAGQQAEIDVFEGRLTGLVVIDFEFTTDKALADFQAPDICLAELTQDAVIAGGQLAGKSYEDVHLALEAYGYKLLHMKGGMA